MQRRSSERERERERERGHATCKASLSLRTLSRSDLNISHLRCISDSLVSRSEFASESFSFFCLSFCTSSCSELQDEERNIVMLMSCRPPFSRTLAVVSDDGGTAADGLGLACGGLYNELASEYSCGSIKD